MYSMRNEIDNEFHTSPSFPTKAREWILSSALYDGIEDEDIRQIQTLLSERGANPNVLLPEYGITPFHLVVANENISFAVQATDICLQHGADPNVRSEDGLTPVHLAAMWGCPEVLQVLLASGGNPWLVDCFEKNAFHYARSEGQHECYNILNQHCKAKQIHDGNPYQLNLKHVILYKKDLQIVYEALPSVSRKCASTQTPSSPQQSKDYPAKEALNGVSETKRKVKQSIQEYSSSSSSTKKNKQINIVGKDVSAKNQSHIALNGKLKEVIVSHRKNSTIFEYPPSSEVMSGRNVSEVTPSVSELIEKLEKANIFRQSLKSISNQHEKLRNVTQRKRKPCLQTEPDLSSSSERSVSEYQSCSRNSVAFNDTNTEPTLSSLENPLDSPSIGFILDNLDKTQHRTRGSSLFSDIASDVEVYSPNEQEMDRCYDIMTEDESSPGEKSSIMHSSSDLLYPYVSCREGSTRECETSECFETCQETSESLELPHTSKTQTHDRNRYQTSVNRSVVQDVNSVIDSILNNVEGEKITPVNPKMITSTPERLASGSDEATNWSGKKSQGWVNANVLSSDEDQCMSISEEYEYTDVDEGVVLIERRYLLSDDRISNASKRTHRTSSTSEESEVSTASGSDAAYDTGELRQALKDYGFTPGPITGNTKRVYLRKLKRCKRHPPPPVPVGQPAFSPELLKTLNTSCEHLLMEWAHLEDSMSASFTCSRKPWREGQAKTSFTYLLLDPRLVHDLPAFAATIKHTHLWPAFLKAIFYVGKGKRARPYAHLYQAVANWQKQEVCNSKKILRIMDIWQAGLGVVCLHVFQNIIPVEALTREAAMISALTLPQLTNEKAGEFYGSAGCWSLRLKRRLGCVLLHRAFKVFLAEGERQLRPADID